LIVWQSLDRDALRYALDEADRLENPENGGEKMHPLHEFTVYTRLSWRNFLAAMAEAEDVYDNVPKNYNQSEIDEMTNKLNMAMLQLAGWDMADEREELEEVLDQAKALNPASYTPEDWAVVQDWIERAEERLIYGSLTFIEMFGFIAEMRAALDDLVEIGATVYTVTFISQSETLSTIQVVSGRKVARPDDPTMEGYTFEGWMLDGDEFDFGTAIAQDVTLVAEWKLIPVTSLRINAAIIETVARGWRYNFGVILNEGAIDKNVVWTISHPGLASVDEAGNVTIFERTGTVVLLATDTVNNISHSITLRIAS